MAFAGACLTCTGRVKRKGKQYRASIGNGLRLIREVSSLQNPGHLSIVCAVALERLFQEHPVSAQAHKRSSYTLPQRLATWLDNICFVLGTSCILTNVDERKSMDVFLEGPHHECRLAPTRGDNSNQLSLWRIRA